MKASHRSPVRLRSNTLVSPVQASHLPQGFVYVVIVGAVAAWSWERWQSAHITALAALSASACMLVLEIALSAASPWAARAVFGLSRGVHHPSSAAPSREGVDRTLSDAETRIREAAARLEKAQQRIEELELDRDRQEVHPGARIESTPAPRARPDPEQPIEPSQREAAAVDLEGVHRAPANAPKNVDVPYPETPSTAAPRDAQPPARTSRTRLSLANVSFVILSVIATLMFSLFVLLLFST